MNVYELNTEQMTALKQKHLFQLADEGCYGEVVGVDYDEPSWQDLANADSLIDDAMIYREYEGIDFVEEDFPN